MKPEIIAISGLPASGKSTLAKMLAKKSKYNYLHTGKLFRSLAKKKNMTLSEFEVYCLKHPNYDIKIDKQMLSYVKTHNQVIYDGHISGPLCFKHKIPSIKIWVNITKNLRIERIALRENISKNKAKELINHREKFLTKRYKKLYNIKYYDKSVYDLIIDNKPLPKTVLSNTLKALKSLDK